ncbi:MAG: glycosyltransferase family 2 protein [Paludibacteraceae bacterium]|nr:glycosyltransferase family 2 protein [Paludibacteraceae bacterium]
MSDIQRPKIIVLTPVRNEAWVLPAFLKATSLWADHIIIADQMSTDGSREMYTQYEKAIVVDNHDEEMHQGRARQLLFAEANKIGGEKILIALDADEFLSGAFKDTAGWKILMNSIPGDVFYSRRKDIYRKEEYLCTGYMFIGIHVSAEEDLTQNAYPDNYIHEPKLPWPSVPHEEYYLEDLFFFHIPFLNKVRNWNKSVFYMVSTATKQSYSMIRMYRQYFLQLPNKYLKISDEFTFYEKQGIDILQNIDFSDRGLYYLNVIKEYMKQNGYRYYSRLDIWTPDLLSELQIKDPRSMFVKIIHLYLEKTRNYRQLWIIRFIDWGLKRFV